MFNTTRSSIPGKKGGLYDACLKGNITDVRKLLREDAYLDEENSDGRSPIWAACDSGNLEIVKELISAGIDVEFSRSSEYLRPPLLVYCVDKNIEILKELLKCNININISDDYGETALLTACLQRNVVAATLLIEHGADLYRERVGGESPLLAASHNNDVVLLQELIRWKADINRPNQFGITPLFQAVLDGSTDIVRELIRAGVDINYPSKRGQSPLLKAIENDESDIAHMLIEAGADVHKEELILDRDFRSRDEEPQAGYSPLELACREGNLQVAKALLLAGAVVNKATNKFGMTPLLAACTASNVELVTELLHAGADINQSNKNDENPLHLAIRDGSKEVALLLIKAGANCRMTGKPYDRQRNPLWAACLNGYLDVVEALLQVGSDINACTDYLNEEKYDEDEGVKLEEYSEWTPLLIACRKGHSDIVSALIAAGADMNLASSNGESPVYKAYEYEHVEIVDILKAAGAIYQEKVLLEQACECYGYIFDGGEEREEETETLDTMLAAGCDINVTDDQHRTLLWEAAKSGELDRIELLLEKGANVDIPNQAGETPLWIASANGHLVCVQRLLLLEATKSDIHLPNHAGITALAVAIENNHHEIVQLLQSHMMSKMK